MPWFTLCWLVIAAVFVGAAASRSRSDALRLAFTAMSLALLTATLLPIVGSTVAPHYDQDLPPAALLSEKLFVAAWWVLVARTAIFSGRIAMRIDRRPHAARLASDLAAGAVYLGAWLAVVDVAFGVSVTGLVATSGIIAIVLGLALQSTLGDLFSGVAIGIDRPFGIGDLVWVEGGIEGRVVETNWRSTRIMTAASDVATIPNSVVAKSRLLNRSAPSENRTDSVKIMLDPAVPPETGVALLKAASLNATASTFGVLPTVLCTDLSGHGTSYEIGFTAPLGQMGEIRSDLLRQVARHARHKGVALAPQNGTVLVPIKAPAPADLLKTVALFDVLTPEDLESFASRLVARRGKAGEAIFVQGGAVASLFIIAEGAFEATRDEGSGPRRLGTLGPGDDVGQMALLTGSDNPVTITALTRFAIYEVTKDMIAPLLRDNPALVRSLEAGAARSQAALDRFVPPRAGQGDDADVNLLDRIRAFFAMRDAAA